MTKKKAIFKKIDAILKSNRKNSLGHLKSKKNSYIFYDKSNSILRKLLNQLLRS